MKRGERKYGQVPQKSPGKKAFGYFIVGHCVCARAQVYVHVCVCVWDSR